MSTLSHPVAALRKFLSGLVNARHYGELFAMSQAELALRGLDRDRFVRSYISGFAYS